MFNQNCLMCRYNDRPIDYINLERIRDKLSFKVKEHNKSKEKGYNWVNNNLKCNSAYMNINTKCQKIANYKRKFDQITDELDNLMNNYIETTDCSDYHEILNYLRGTYSNVYTDFERRVLKKLHKGEST